MGNHPAPSKEMNVSGSFDDLDVTSEIFKKKDTHTKDLGKGCGRRQKELGRGGHMAQLF